MKVTVAGAAGDGWALTAAVAAAEGDTVGAACGVSLPEVPHAGSQVTNSSAARPIFAERNRFPTNIDFI
ncbi:hypothetical protein D3C81_2269830 [compost metagenome]